MIPHRFESHTFSFLMTLAMSGVVSLAMLPIDSMAFIDVMTNWPRSWGLSMLVAFPISIFVVPLTRKLVARIVASE